MRYEYKTVSLLHYIGKGAGKGAGFGAADALGSIWEQSKKIADVVEHCLNHYAQDGWQFIRLVEISSKNLSSVGGMLTKGAMTAVFGKSNKEQNNEMYPLIFFRREVDGTEVKHDQRANPSVNTVQQFTQQDIASSESTAKLRNLSRAEEDIKNSLTQDQWEELVASSKAMEKSIVELKVITDKLMKELNITYSDKKYLFKSHTYDFLNDAVNYARKNP